MLVYRLCKKSEILKLFNDKNFANIGNAFITNQNVNSHLYNNKQKYIHFFESLDSIFYLRSIKNHYLCTYNIPKYILEQRVGKGLYLDRISFKTTEEVNEYAIENNLVSFDNLLKVDEIIDYIDFEDYINNEMVSKVKTRYHKENVLLDSKIKNLDMLYDILMDDNVVQSINSNLQFLVSLIPELKAMIGFEHKHPHHHLDVWEHTLYALSLSTNNFDVRLSLLLHDIGKPFSFIEENGIRHFLNHANVSENISRMILNRLGFDNNYINMICHFVELHDTPISEEDIKKDYESSYTLYQIQECDALAHNPDKLEKREKYLSKIKNMMK